MDEKDMAPDVVEDYREGLEYATAVDIVDFVQVGLWMNGSVMCG